MLVKVSHASWRLLSMDPAVAMRWMRDNLLRINCSQEVEPLEKSED
jgi:hypothetical protein